MDFAGCFLLLCHLRTLLLFLRNALIFYYYCYIFLGDKGERGKTKQRTYRILGGPGVLFIQIFLCGREQKRLSSLRYGIQHYQRHRFFFSLSSIAFCVPRLSFMSHQKSTTAWLAQSLSRHRERHHATGSGCMYACMRHGYMSVMGTDRGRLYSSSIFSLKRRKARDFVPRKYRIVHSSRLMPLQPRRQNEKMQSIPLS